MQTNKEHILTHIEASAPCSLFSVALWADDQLTVSATSFAHIVDSLVSDGKIAITSDETGIVVDLL